VSCKTDLNKFRDLEYLAILNEEISFRFRIKNFTDSLLHRLFLFGGWNISSSRYLLIMPLYGFIRNRQYIDTGQKNSPILEMRTSENKAAEQLNPPF
jgi:hypothetical protein